MVASQRVAVFSRFSVCETLLPFLPRELGSFRL